MTEHEWDKLLKIKTSGRDDSHSDTIHYPYEPTPYSVLTRIVQSGLLTKKNTVLDYGSGKGRVPFYLSYETKCKSIGVEYDELLYSQALDNQKGAVSGQRVTFVHKSAEDFIVPENVDRFFFFNPFSELVLSTVLSKVKESYYINGREIKLFFYYPSDEYLGILMNDPELSFETEIDTSDLFEGKNKRERILVFSLG